MHAFMHRTFEKQLNRWNSDGNILLFHIDDISIAVK